MPGCLLPPRTPAVATRTVRSSWRTKLIQNSPKVRDVWTTLGVAHYRAGAWNDAIAALEKSEAAAPRAIHRR